MTLAEQLRPKIDLWKPTERSAVTIPAPEAGWSVTLTADHNDLVGMMLWEMTLTRTTPAPATETLDRWANRVAAQSSGLMERLKRLELDEAAQVALLRSDSPSSKAGDVTYYELKLHGTTHAELRRYQASRSRSSRDQILFPVTHEALLKLLSDISS